MMINRSMGKARKQKERFYIAYGSNLNLEQMAVRCPTAEIVGTAVLHGWRLMFRNVATVERCAGHTVPVLVWRLQPKDELALDRYEGWPHLYRKETLRITVNRRRVYAMIYIMNEASYPYGSPSPGYFQTIHMGYKSAEFDTDILTQAVLNSQNQQRGGI